MNWKRNARRSGLLPAMSLRWLAGRHPRIAPAIVLLCLVAMPVAAADLPSANALYDAGKFGAAATAYEAITPKTSAVYFNLGNAYFRQEKLGLAMLNFERARKLAPRDPDVLANLRFAEARLGVADVNEPAGAFRAYLEPAAQSRTLSEWRLVEVAGIWLSVLAFAAWLWLPRWRFGLAVVFTVALLGLLAATAALVWQTMRPPAAVAVAGAEARFAPLGEATVHFRVGEGTKLSVLEDRGSWWFVERADRRRGWVPASALQLVHTH